MTLPFTALIGTPSSMPGQIEPGLFTGNFAVGVSIVGAAVTTADATRVRQATSSIAGSSTVIAGIEDHEEIAASLAGGSAVTASAGKLQHISASIAGSAAFTATATEEELPHASMVGRAIFFIDPTKVVVLSFFKPGSIPAGFAAPKTVVPKQQSAGALPDHLTVGGPGGRKPPNSQKGGVPNEG